MSNASQKIAAIARTSQADAVDNNNRTDLVCNAYRELVIAGFNWSYLATAMLESNPLSDHHLETTLVSATNITTNTTSYAYIDMDGYSCVGILGDTSGATPTDVLTCTIEGTTQDDGTAQASCVYVDCTKMFIDAATGTTGTASWVDTDFAAISPTNIPFKYIRVKYVTSNAAGNDADLTLYVKKLY